MGAEKMIRGILILFAIALLASCGFSASEKKTNTPVLDVPVATDTKQDSILCEQEPVSDKDYNVFKACFPDIVPGEFFAESKEPMKKEGIAEQLFTATDEEIESGGSEQLYPVGKILGYKGNLDLFIIDHEYTRAEEDSYDSHSEGYRYLIIFKDKKPMKREGNELLVHTLNVAGYGEGGKYELRSFIEKDTTFSCYHYASESESATGYNTPFITETNYHWALNTDGKVCIEEVTEVLFSSPFYHMPELEKHDPTWTESDRRSYPIEEDKWGLFYDGIIYLMWQYEAEISKKKLRLDFFVNKINDKLYPVFETRDEDNNLIDSYIVGQSNREKEETNSESDSTYRSLLARPVVISTSDGDIEMMPSGVFRMK